MNLYNPFPQLSTELLSGLLAAGKTWWIRQSYIRGCRLEDRAAFLFKAYDRDQETLAREHYAAIESDTYRFLYDALNEEHRLRLTIAASQPAGFRTFYAGKKGSTWSPPPLYENRIKSYIRSNHPDWKPGSAKKAIKAGIFEKFGILYLELGFEEQTDIVLLSKLES